MINQEIFPIILSGGIGARLWPLSREAHPKPFIKLQDKKSLIQKTYQRAQELTKAKEIITVTNRELVFYTKDEFTAVMPASISHTLLLEPLRRNSTAAIALAAEYVQSRYGDEAILLVFPADHLIANQQNFNEAVLLAIKLARSKKLVTFGIKPTAPDTNFGYIQAEGDEVKKFVEKPSKKQAEKYIKKGDFFWNAGIFCMPASIFLNELNLYKPKIAKQIALCQNNSTTLQGKNYRQIDYNSKHFEQIEDISVDYAIFEKSTNVAFVPCNNISWSDVGSWNQFGNLLPKDNFGNHKLGNIITEQVEDCIIHTEQAKAKTVAALGIKELVIADTTDALLIAHRSKVQELKKIVSILEKQNSPVFKSFPKVHRPWGSYTVLLEGVGFKLKKIEVYPSERLSLQSHKHRSEHWVVVGGTAIVTNEEKIIELKKNESTYIPVGNKHRLENQTTELLILIEVQCGDYLGEDDIVRYEDKYSRK